MGRGHKICICGCSNGPRSFSCKSCGKGFIVKGVKQPDINPETTKNPNPLQIKECKSIKEKNKLSKFIQKCADENELSKYSRVWDSINGHYRIRLSPKMFGVNMSPFGKFQLLEFCLDHWKPIDRFKKLTQAINHFIKMEKKHAVCV